MTEDQTIKMWTTAGCAVAFYAMAIIGYFILSRWEADGAKSHIHLFWSSLYKAGGKGLAVGVYVAIGLVFTIVSIMTYLRRSGG